ncbi:hypothetical protein K438DRAFT_1759225 [Mycena galopus ATCC 62051]|nr:hypothetical protein K438DRAFT_1759225 [Mycena galopus ATCC 62051]
MSGSFMPHWPSSRNSPTSMRTEATVAAIPETRHCPPTATSNSRDQIPSQPPKKSDSDSGEESWTSAKGAKVDLTACGNLPKYKIEPALLYKEITGKTSEPEKGFVQAINTMLERANEEFLAEIPRYALAKAYERRAITHGQNLEKAMVDYFISLQLFPEGNEEQEDKVRREMLNVVKVFHEKMNTGRGSRGN